MKKIGKITWNGELLDVVESTYQSNDNVALMLMDIDGAPYGVASVNLDNVPLMDNKNFTHIKNWSENEGVLEALVEADLVEEIGVRTATGFVQADLVRLKYKRNNSQ